jgi:hypothetical protein
VSKRGFQLETHSALRFGSEIICPSRGGLENAHSGLLICRDWHRDLKHFIEEGILFAEVARRDVFSIGTSWGFDHLLELGATTLLLLRVDH